MSNTHFKDYYKILGIEPDSSAEQIKKAYRKLAFEYHPDRNSENREQAETKFKEVTEAYGVLIDPQKRSQYDSLRAQGSGARQAYRDFSQFGQQGRGSYEDLFQDLFQNPEMQRIFREMRKDFSSRGMRFDDKFFDNLFFGGRGVIFGGFFVFGPGGLRNFRSFGPKKGSRAFKGGLEFEDLAQKPKKGIKDKIFEKLGRKIKKLALDTAPEEQGEDLSLRYSLSIGAEEASMGTEVSIAIKRGKKQEKLLVKIPAQTKPGAVLRLKGKGHVSKQGNQAGDLYIKVDVEGT